jgi:hypothetical protein
MKELSCMYVGDACVSSVFPSDAVTISTAERISVLPESCEHNTAVDPAPTDRPTEKLRETISSPTTLSDAATRFANGVIELQKTIDPVTGTKVAGQVSIVVLSVSSPEKNADGSYKFSLTVVFIPYGSVVVGEDHKRVYCPLLKVFIRDLTKVELSTDCKFTERVGVKREVSQSSSKTYDMSANAPGSSVNALYGSSAASTVVVAFGAALISLFVALFM